MKICDLLRSQNPRGLDVIDQAQAPSSIPIIIAAVTMHFVSCQMKLGLPVFFVVDVLYQQRNAQIYSRLDAAKMLVDLRLHQLVGGSTGPGCCLLLFYWRENIFN